MPRLCVLLPLVVFLAGCVAQGTGTASSEGAVSFNEAEKVHGVALVRRYVEEQGIAPDQATYRLDEQISFDATGGNPKKSRQMFVIVDFKDRRQPWRLLVLPDGSLKRVEGGEPPTTEPADTAESG
ncbi:MAG TPA: hypothetical protein VND64_28325 [Pirellulales bacterium]|jgi:hypothetical protein|nr:hypothetical protein [Pirellulales bacterium]